MPTSAARPGPSRTLTCTNARIAGPSSGTWWMPATRTRNSATHDQLGDRHAELPPDVQVAAEGSLAPEPSMSPCRTRTTDRITSPASIARKASSRSVRRAARASPSRRGPGGRRRAQPGHLGKSSDGIGSPPSVIRSDVFRRVGGMIGPVPGERDLGGDRRHADRDRGSRVVEHRHRLRRRPTGRPVASNATSTPSPCVSSRTAATASVADASTTSVAPNRSAHARASARRGRRRSAARRPRSSPPASAARPIPPRPITATRVAGRTRFAVLIAAPTPVEAPQPSRQALRSGSSGGIGIAWAAWTTVWVASVPSERVPASGAASRARRTRGGCCHAWEQRRGTPRRHGPHVPHGTAQASTTGSPSRSVSTPSPTSSMTPAPS